MAKRRIIIDGETILADSDRSIHAALEQAGMENVPSVVSGGQVITASEFDRPIPAHDMLTNQTDIEKGAPLRERLLDREFELITRFLREYPGKPRTLEMDDNTLLIKSFPLPDSYATDHVDLLFVISGYFEVPPAGVHIPRNSPNRQQIADHLGGHVMTGTPSHLLNHTPASYREQVKKLVDETWDWVCFHYQDWTWKFNPNNLLSGDCLFKFIENTFAALSGRHR